MITSVIFKLMIIDIWQDTDRKVSIILTLPIAILLDIALAPVEIGAGIIYLIRTRKDKEVEKCTDYMHKEEKVDMKIK